MAAVIAPLDLEAHGVGEEDMEDDPPRMQTTSEVGTLAYGSRARAVSTGLTVDEEEGRVGPSSAETKKEKVEEKTKGKQPKRSSANQTCGGREARKERKRKLRRLRRHQRHLRKQREREMRRLTPRDRRQVNVSKLAFELVRHHEHYKAVRNAVITVTLTAAL